MSLQLGIGKASFEINFNLKGDQDTMNKKDRREYEFLLDAAEKRIINGKAKFGDHGLIKFYKQKLKEAD